MEYKLVTRSGETIKKVRAESMEIAIEFFCGIKNLKPKELYKKEIDLHPNSDTLCLSEPLWLFEKVYKKVPPYLENKKRIMLYGLNLLKQKNCKISDYIFFKNF